MRKPQRPPTRSAHQLAALPPVDFDEIIRETIQSEAGGKYRHWDTLRHLTPPAGFTSVQWWDAVKLVRRAGRRELPLRDPGGRPFSYGTPTVLQQRLHWVDLAAGMIGMPLPLTDPQTRDRYIQRSLLQESVTSSQLEGAAATRATAQAMLASKRPPRTLGERMIANNYRTMVGISEWQQSPLTPALICEIQRVVTAGTLESEEASGRLRRADEAVTVQDTTTGEVYHLPPPAAELDERLEKLCAFANEDTSQEGAPAESFIHPVVRAILLHFWLAYDHPFVDGNGRTARALFYWSMLRRGYSLFRFLSISEVLLRAPIQYAMAFLHTETDDNDATYFLLQQTGVICQAITTLREYVQGKDKELRDTQTLLRHVEGLNSRQLALIAHALRSPNATYTVEGHRRNHWTVYETARRDLLDLVAGGWLVMKKIGRKFVFTATPALSARARGGVPPG